MSCEVVVLHEMAHVLLIGFWDLLSTAAQCDLTDFFTDAYLDGGGTKKREKATQTWVRRMYSRFYSRCSAIRMSFQIRVDQLEIQCYKCFWMEGPKLPWACHPPLVISIGT